MKHSILLLVFSLINGFSPSADAGEPTNQVKKRIETISSILLSEDNREDGKLKSDAIEQIRDELESFFSWEEMSRRAVGLKTKDWMAVPKEQRTAYIYALKGLLEETYLARLNEYTGEKFSFPEGGERITSKGRKAQVESHFHLADKQVPIVYKLFLRDGTWWVYDIKVEEVGMVMNYKTQFETIMDKGGIPEVTKRLVEKLQEVKKKRDAK